MSSKEKNNSSKPSNETKFSETPFWLIEELIEEIISNIPHPQRWSKKKRKEAAFRAIFGDWNDKKGRGVKSKVNLSLLEDIFNELRKNNFMKLEKGARDELIKSTVDNLCKYRPDRFASLEQYRRTMRENVKKRINKKDGICFYPLSERFKSQKEMTDFLRDANLYRFTGSSPYQLNIIGKTFKKFLRVYNAKIRSDVK